MVYVWELYGTEEATLLYNQALATPIVLKDQFTIVVDLNKGYVNNKACEIFLIFSVLFVNRWEMHHVTVRYMPLLKLHYIGSAEQCFRQLPLTVSANTTIYFQHDSE